MKILLSFLFQCLCTIGFSQYIGVKARYTETRLVQNVPEPPSRENRLILSFYTVDAGGVYTPVYLSDYPIYIYKTGFQFGSINGGVLDSTGNNYPGYPYTAPKVVSYYNSFGSNYIDCDPNLATPYTVNGFELDCGFVPVSSWENYNESFTAPNVCLPYYSYPNPYSIFPGNVNFNWPIPATEPYNYYSFSCAGGTQQVVIRGVLPADTLSDELIGLPVHFTDVKASMVSAEKIKVSWSNLTESDIAYYEIERSEDGINFHAITKLPPQFNNGNRADYYFFDRALHNTPSPFYRIKAVEHIGHQLYSVIVRINVPGIQSKLSVYPNPVVTSSFQFRLIDAPIGKYQIDLMNASGQVKLLHLSDHAGGIMTMVIDIDVPDGVYYLIIRSAKERYAEKIIVHH